MRITFPIQDALPPPRGRTAADRCRWPCGRRGGGRRPTAWSGAPAAGAPATAPARRMPRRRGTTSPRAPRTPEGRKGQRNCSLTHLSQRPCNHLLDAMHCFRAIIILCWCVVRKQAIAWQREGVTFILKPVTFGVRSNSFRHHPSPPSPSS